MFSLEILSKILQLCDPKTGTLLASTCRSLKNEKSFILSNNIDCYFLQSCDHKIKNINKFSAAIYNNITSETMALEMIKSNNFSFLKYAPYQLISQTKIILAIAKKLEIPFTSNIFDFYHSCKLPLNQFPVTLMTKKYIDLQYPGNIAKSDIPRYLISEESIDKVKKYILEHPRRIHIAPHFCDHQLILSVTYENLCRIFNVPPEFLSDNLIIDILENNKIYIKQKNLGRYEPFYINPTMASLENIPEHVNFFRLIPDHAKTDKLLEYIINHYPKNIWIFPPEKHPKEFISDNLYEYVLRFSKFPENIQQLIISIYLDNYPNIYFDIFSFSLVKSSSFNEENIIKAVEKVPWDSLDKELLIRYLNL